MITSMNGIVIESRVGQWGNIQDGSAGIVAKERGLVAGSVAEGMAICTNNVVIQHPRIVRDAARGEAVIAM